MSTINKPVIFADCHHLSLFNSLRLLFENRLDGTLYRPIGKEWFEKGYWRMAEIYNNAPETIEQYLGIRPGFTPTDGSMPLNRLQKIEDEVYYVWDPEYEYYHKAITLDKFFKIPIDIVIASIPEHIQSFQRLCDEHPNKPKLIYQVGNTWTIQEGSAKNIMASAIIKDVPPDINFVQYHQQFDLDIFHYEPVKNNRKIYSFINCLNTADIYRDDWALFLQLEKLMPDWEFKSFGGSCRDGAAHGAKALADKMREATLIFHSKQFGDGFGHIIHNAAAVGRPLITRYSDYKGKLAEPLMHEGAVVMVDNRTPEQIVKEIEGSNIEYMGQRIYDNFKNSVDFDKEAEDIKMFIQMLK